MLRDALGFRAEKVAAILEVSPQSDPRGGPAPALAQGVDAAVRRDPVEPRAQRGAPLKAVEPAPGGEQRLPDQVLGVVQGAEHAGAVQLELAPVRLDERRERALVTCLARSIGIARSDTGPGEN